MRERGNGLGLAFETRERLTVVCETLGQDLDCHVTVQPGIPGAIHFAHATRAEGRQDLVGSETRAGGQRH